MFKSDIMNNQKNQNSMASVFISTGKMIKYPNGHKSSIYMKLTKTGVRYYRWEPFDGRYFPISEKEVNERLHIDNPVS